MNKLLNFLRKLYKSQAIQNSFWGVLNAVVHPILMLLAIPIFISYLGIEQFGGWSIINSIIASMGIFNMGLGSATVNFIAKYRANDDWDNIYRVINTTFSIYLILSIAITTIGILSTDLLIDYKVFNIPTQHVELTRYTLRIGFFIVGLRYIEGVLVSIFVGFERNDISSKIHISSKALLIAVQLTLVVMNFSLIAVFIATAIMSILSLIIELYIVKRFVKGLKFSLLFSKSSFKEVFSFGIWTWTQSIVGIISGQIDKFIVVWLSGLGVFGYYSIGQEVATRIHGLFGAATSWIFPKIAKETAKNNDILPFYYNMQFLIISIGILSVSTLFYTRDFFFTLWLGAEKYAQSVDFITVFLYFNIFSVTTIVPYHFLNSGGYVRGNTFFIAFSSLVTVVSMIVLYQFFGVIGLPLGRLVSPAITSLGSRTIVHLKILKDKDIFSGAKIILPSWIAVIILYLGEQNILPFYVQLICFAFLAWVIQWIFGQKVNISKLVKSI
ncbi:MAG: oligosaccharide flippase family protein [Thermoflexibacter sp.]|nr:oligosaccharide flippase family protein [Thermoflexibacter sp.]